MIRLIEDTIDLDDMNSLIDWLKTYPRLTKGPLTLEFEKKWSNWIGCKHSLFVNSGSSANLIVLAALKFSNLLKNNKILIPGLAWATDLSPVIQLGLEPLLCDINLNNLSIDLDLLESYLKDDEQKPSCVLLVSVLGLVPEMDKIKNLCDKYDVILIGDHCESFGSKFNDKKLGACGEFASTFSLYFGHHLSTIEGGMVCTNDDDFYDALLMLRSHGWSRDLSVNKQNDLKSKWQINDFNNLYTFYLPGFNLRATDLQAKIGIGQLDKADSICENRNINFQLLSSLVNTNELTIDANNNYISAFAYPFVNKNINIIIEQLINNNIECRPLICGSMGNQPMYVDRYGKLDLKNCNLIDNYGIYVPCHDKLTDKNIYQIAEILNGV